MKRILLFSLLYFFFSKANGQVYTAGSHFDNYTDLNPDTLMHYTLFPYVHQIYDLPIFAPSPGVELIADGSVSSGGHSAYINIHSLDSNVYISMGRLDSVFDSTSTSWLVTKVAKPLNAGDAINTSGTVWDKGVLYLSDHSGSFGWTKNINDWIGGEKYIGLKYDNGITLAYGWIHVQCVSEDSCWVKEYSFTNSVAGITELQNAGALLFPNPVTSKLTINFNTEFQAKEIRLYNLNGSCILKRPVTHTAKEEIDVASLPTGFYSLLVLAKNGEMMSRIIKK